MQLQIFIEFDDNQELKWFSVDGNRTRICGNRWEGLQAALTHLSRCQCALTGGECEREKESAWPSKQERGVETKYGCISPPFDHITHQMGMFPMQSALK
jgi:hypothetical protein